MEYNNILKQLSLKNNIFDLVRLLAAFIVLIYHACFTVPFGTSLNNDFIYRYSNGLDTIGNVCVIIFFCISGFLISNSWIRDPSWKEFIGKRLSRIMPGLVVCILFTTLVVGPLLTNISLANYFSSNLFFQYFYHIFFLFGKGGENLPGVFLLNNINSTNASLWSIRTEFFLYISLVFFGIIGLINKRVVFLVIFILTLIIYLNIEYYNSSFLKLFIPNSSYDNLIYGFGSFLRYLLVFISGILLRIFSDKIEYSKRFLMIVVLFSCLFLLTKKIFFYDIFIILLLPYIIIFISLIQNVKIKEFFARFGDISYGLYIYHQLLMQIIVAICLQYFNFKINSTQLLFLSIPLSLLAGILSWNLIEKPFLHKKKI
jgi:peptidoglycan/LPS O-acetylase OafA/YrhL